MPDSLLDHAGDDTMTLGPSHDLDDLGARLGALRRARGLSQEGLAELADVSPRVIAYHGTESAQPPGMMLVVLGRALKVSTDDRSTKRSWSSSPAYFRSNRASRASRTR